MPPPNQRTTPPCWECDEPTDEPATVTLRTSLRDMATLTLCVRCYRTCYMPLAMTLSPQQWEIAALVVEGLSNATIAERLRLTRNEVNHHVGRALHALRLKTRLRLAAWAAKTLLLR